MTESGHQVCLFRWAFYARKQYPALRMLYAIPNGGMRHKAVAGQLRAEGVKAGVLDINLDAARQGFHGLRIEMKKPAEGKSRAGQLSPEQKEWLANLAEEGYRAEVAYGWERAKQIIEDYLA